MAIKIQHLYSTNVYVIFYSYNGLTICRSDNGIFDDIIERTTETIVKHKLRKAEIYQEDTGEILTIIERNNPSFIYFVLNKAPGRKSLHTFYFSPIVFSPKV